MLAITKICKELSLLKPQIPAIMLTAQKKTRTKRKRAPKCSAHRGPGAKAKRSSQGLDKGPVCPGVEAAGEGGGGGGSDSGGLKRGLKSGKVRMGLIPEEFFLFFYSKTGVTGPYLFIIMLTNYLVSKEKFVMEHEYYIGLSMFVMSYYVTTNFGSAVGAALDKQVDEVANAFEKIRSDEIGMYDGIKKQAQDGQARALGQKLLMEAKKENIAMQLEAIYRERLMHVYRATRGRMEYQIKLYSSQARIQQKWMLGWILKRVKESITPELEQQALARAIDDLATAASAASAAKPTSPTSPASPTDSDKPKPK